MIEFTKEELCERIEKLENDIEEKNEYIKKLEIENNLMKEILARPPMYTYGVR